MKTQKFTKTLTATAILSAALCESVLAQDEVSCSGDLSTALKCWKCGANCVAGLGENGQLTVTGYGDMYDYWYENINDHTYATTPWARENITSVHIGKDIESTGRYAFSNISSISEVSFEEGSKLTKIMPNTFEATGINELFVPDSVEHIYWWAFGNRNVHLYCTGKQIESACIASHFGNRSSIPTTHYEPNGENIIIYNTDGSIEGIYKDYNSMKSGNRVDIHMLVDESGKIIAKLTGDGNVINSYVHNPNGSIGTYDANGKLTGMQKRGPFTIPEADAATQGKGPFRLDITW